MAGSDYEVVTSCRNSCHPASDVDKIAGCPMPFRAHRESRPRRRAPPAPPGPHRPARGTAAHPRRGLCRRAPGAARLGVRFRHRGGRGTRTSGAGDRAVVDHGAGGPALHRDGGGHNWLPDARGRWHRNCCVRSPSGTVTYMQVTDLASRYRAAAGTDDRVAERGDAACARGHDDERAWSRPDTPTQVAGRYRCRVAPAHADDVVDGRRCRRARARDTRRWRPGRALLLVAGARRASLTRAGRRW